MEFRFDTREAVEVSLDTRCPEQKFLFLNPLSFSKLSFPKNCNLPGLASS
jgi:hypothetical protein